jgi:hypothetical protein
MMSSRNPYLRRNQAIDLLHVKDSRMVAMHTNAGQGWFILPHGGRVKPDDAAKILARSDICGQGDCLFPGLSQTYRMVR